MPPARRSSRSKVSPPECAESGVRVGDACSVEQVQQERQGGIADVAVQPRHRAGFDGATEPGTQDEVGAFGQQPQQLVEAREVVGAVGVADDNDLAARGRDARLVGVAVAAFGHADNARARRLGRLERAVGRAVVGHHHLSLDAGTREAFPRLLDAGDDCGPLVEAGHHHRDVHGTPAHDRALRPSHTNARQPTIANPLSTAPVMTAGGRYSNRTMCRPAGTDTARNA